jgi:hypothetical protein
MQGVTLTIAAVFSVLVLILPPHYAFAAYIASLLWYPSYLVVSIGTIDISVGRIVVSVLLLRCLCDSRILSRFSSSWLDAFVAFSMVVYVVTFCITHPFSSAIENRAGFLMDTCFAYMVSRLIVTDRAKLLSIIKLVSIVLVPLAILGVIESFTNWQPFNPLFRFCPWFGEIRPVPQERWGLTRALGPFSHPITFGCSFAIFLPLIFYLRHERNNWHVLAYIFSGTALIGALTSMSSGPWVMAIVAVFCLALEKRKLWVKPLIILFFFLCIFTEVVSNRPFYHVIASYANLLGGAGWHRAHLIDIAIERFDEWWLIGYGGKDPGWGPNLGMVHTDLTNEFILAGVRYGILGIIALCGSLILAFHGLIFAHKGIEDQRLKSLYWSLGTILFSVAVTWMSVSFFDQLGTLFYCVLGLTGSSFHFVRYDKVSTSSSWREKVYLNDCRSA